MVVALADHVTLTDLELRACAQALEPKKLVTIDGGHFDPYLGSSRRRVPLQCPGSVSIWAKINDRGISR